MHDIWRLKEFLINIVFGHLLVFKCPIDLFRPRLYHAHDRRDFNFVASKKVLPTPTLSWIPSRIQPLRLWERIARLRRIVSPHDSEFTSRSHNPAWKGDGNQPILQAAPEWRRISLILWLIAVAITLNSLVCIGYLSIAVSINNWNHDRLLIGALKKYCFILIKYICVIS